MAGVSVLAPAVLAVACLLSGNSAPFVERAGLFCLALSALLAAAWIYSFWALYVARPRAPRQNLQSRKVSLEWSALDDFEDFAPLLALKQLDFKGENITGALVQELRLDLEASLRSGSHELKISEHSSLLFLGFNLLQVDGLMGFLQSFGGGGQGENCRG